MNYSFDTSSLINSWNRHYRIEVFPTVWQSLAEQINNQIVVAQQLVYHEIAEKDDDLKEWVEQRPDFFVPFDDEVFSIAKDILESHPQNVNRRSRFGADAFVVALAIQHNLKVVTEEDLEGSSERKPKIPYICDKRDVTCIKFIDFMSEMGWKF